VLAIVTKFAGEKSSGIGTIMKAHLKQFRIFCRLIAVGES
jgi:hypothetical protein